MINTYRANQLRQQILSLRSEQRAAETRLDMAIQAELRGRAQMEAALADQQTCRATIEARADDICQAQDRLDALVPSQRDP